ncbi:Zinc finger protein [Fasciola hepatica]|uniref:Zinc finger protein n=1 Tax=Fasciola hepatica TaxID=6192 RepID=A0A2H1CVZ6_FASHE|nr:Zinc finger protein [Fasciola hepatica]
MDSGETKSSGQVVPNDFSIKASSVRLPLLAAGLVNSAVSVLLAQLSTRFFELALLDVHSNLSNTVVSNKKGEEAPQSVSSQSTDEADEVVLAKPEPAECVIQTRQPTVALQTAVANSGNAELSTTTTPPVQLLRVKEEMDCALSAFLTNSTLEPLRVPSQSVFGVPTTSTCSNVTGTFEMTNTSMSTPTTSRVTTVDFMHRYYCNHPGCGKVFFSRSSFVHHKESHGVVKPFRCSFTGCTMCFSNQALLLAHLCTHDPSRLRNQYACNYPECGKVFICHDRLLEHIRIHTGERPYVCDYPGCSHRFARRGNLFAHKRVHLDKTQRRQYHCIQPGCGKTFLYMRSLTEHMNVHMGERPYACDFPNCGKRFTSKSYLHAHRRIHLRAPSTSNYHLPQDGGFNLTPVPITVTVPVPSSSQPNSVTFPPSVSQSDTFIMSYPCYPEHPM